MIIYNVTIKINKSAEAEWMKWMKEIHIPALMATGNFISHRFCRLLNQPEEVEGNTFVIQYYCESLEKLNHYQTHFAPALQKEYNEKFKDLFVAFRSVMEELN
jgi:hypothetical protein